MLSINCGQFQFRFGELPDFVYKPLHLMYGDQPAEAVVGPADFRVSLACDSLLRRLVRPQITFYCDQQAPFRPVPRMQAYPILEWGMNWCIAAHDYTRLLIHAAVLEKDGKAVVFPALPGSGKSTLAAYLAFHGWNLYSDEMALIDSADGSVSPLFRPVCLKNDSIRLVREWLPEATMTKVARDTRKGDIAHLKAMSWLRFKTLKQAKIVGVVFPRYQGKGRFQVRKVDNLQAFRQLCSHAFNYNIIGRMGFHSITRLVNDSKQYAIQYNDLADVSRFLAEEFFA